MTITTEQINNMTKNELIGKVNELESVKSGLANRLGENKKYLTDELTKLLQNLSCCTYTNGALNVKAQSVSLETMYNATTYISVTCDYIITDENNECILHKSFDLRIYEDELRLCYFSMPSDIECFNEAYLVDYLNTISNIAACKAKFVELYKLAVFEDYNDFKQVCIQIARLNSQICAIEHDENIQKITDNLVIDQVYTYPGWDNWFYRIIKITDKQVICKELCAYKNFKKVDAVNRYVYDDKETYHTKVIRHIKKEQFINMIENHTSHLVENDDRNREAE